MKTLTETEYNKLFFEGRSPDEIKFTYQQAWQAKTFEIENYWKRATYSWAFQVASFAGYFAVLNSATYISNPQVLYFISCIGFLTALAWCFINHGSKTWQRHWEKHVDMLEDKVTGPLYKVVTTNKSFSVSKINLMISQYITCIWLLLNLKYLIEHNSLCISKDLSIDWQLLFSTTLTLYFAWQMYFGDGRGRFRHRVINLYKRTYSISEN